MSIRTSFVSLAIGLASIYAPVDLSAEINQKPFTVPELRQWKGGEGRFTPSAESRIVYSDKNPELAHVAERLAQDYTTIAGTDSAWRLMTKVARVTSNCNLSRRRSQIRNNIPSLSTKTVLHLLPRQPKLFTGLHAPCCR